MNKCDIVIPTLPPMNPKVPHTYPISEKENLMRALNHEKPLWMPNLYGSSQMGYLPCNGDMPYNMFGVTNDWFGCSYIFSESYGTATPKPDMFECITEWKEKVKWPDLDAIDWSKPADYIADPQLAQYTTYGNGIFERLHIFEGFENALCDILEEEEVCAEFFSVMADYKIKIFDKMQEQFHFDYVVYNDDWGTAKGAFFSADTFEATLLEPTKRIVNAIHEAGCKVVFHNCGKVDSFIPYLVEEIHVDALEIQTINDIKGILKRYGNKVTVEYQPDPYILYDKDVDLGFLRNYAREIVDNYGAHVNDGAGVVITYSSLYPEVYRVFDEEIYEYSSKVY